MKHFMILESAKHEYRKPGTYRLSIFQIVDNTPQWVSSCEYRPGLSPGIETEVMRHLADKGIINSKYKSGYYEASTDRDFVLHVFTRGYR